MNKQKRYRVILLSAALFVLADLFVLAFLLKPLYGGKPAAAPPAAQPGTVPIVYDEPETDVPSTQAARDTLTISFVGDCMFASNHGRFAEGSFNYTAQVQPTTYFLKNFIDLFHADDFTIGNCEGVLSDSELQEKTVTTQIAFWFKGPARHAQIFRDSGIDLASVVNNHSHDFGQQGSDDTEAALESVGVLPGRRDTVTYTTLKGQKIGILCCSLYSYDYMKDIRPKVYEMNSEGCDLKIVYFHGGIENETRPEDWKIRACHELIDTGVDIIVGSHPHVLQPMEIYKGRPIVYSLGNFCFGGNIHPPKNTAVYQAVYTLESGTVAGREDVLIPCQTYSGQDNNYQPYIVTDEAKKQEILDFMQTPV